ncbi:acyltransferase family protein [Priestia megaterium]|uniref:acyltransferase family protein n=1 Tax=Priestia megaterium TaxID=1404 RepID=UPI003CC634C1
MNWINIIKGFAIIAIIYGHSNNQIAHHYLFWFHVPLFLICSGYLFKRIDKDHSLIKWIINKSKRLLIPYVSFGLLTLLLVEIYNPNQYVESEQIINILKNEGLGYYYGVYWYIGALFLTLLLFAMLTRYINSKAVIFTTSLILYVIAHLHSITQPNLKLPWAAENVPMTAFYFAIGYCLKDIISRIKTYHGLISMSIIGIIVYMEQIGLIKYELDIKAGIYNHWALDIIIPLLCAIVFLIISKWIENSFIGLGVGELGKASLSIMYLHIPIMIVLRDHIQINDLWIATISLVSSYIIHLIMTRTSVARFLFGIPKIKTIRCDSQSRSA